MNARSLLPLLGLVTLFGCQPKPSGPAAPAAEKPKVEADLNQTTLSVEAAKSLKIVTAVVQEREIADAIRLTGLVQAPQGLEVTVTARQAGIVRAAPNPKEAPIPGKSVKADQVLFLLEPVLTPVEQIQIAAQKSGFQNELAKARDAVLVADSEFKRMTDLRKQGLRGDQDVEQAKSRLNNAKSDEAAALEKLALFEKDEGHGSIPKLRPIAVVAPRAGTVLTVPVSPGQYVAAAAPLVQIADLSKPWLRVAVPENDLARVDATRSIEIPLGGKRIAARPIALVPLVDPIRHTADLIYELTDDGVTLARDQVLAVYVPVDQKRMGSIVPYDALVYDTHGSTWVYLDVTPAGAAKNVYQRRRVELGPTVDGGVVVRAEGLAGARVVTSGAGSIFSREFHKPPVKLN